MDKIDGALEVGGILLPNGILLEVFGQNVRLRQGATVLLTVTPAGVITPGAQGSAYTQTYSTASKTTANLTAANPAAVTEYTPHIAGATTVTSNAATDLDTTAAALNTLVDECQVLETEVSALVVDMANVKQNVNAIIDDLQTLGLVL